MHKIVKNEAGQAMQDLVEVLDVLREQCPWDREQTFASLRANTIEECYELTEAIDLGDMAAIKEELGDVLLHILFYSKMASEQGAFTIEDVVRELIGKLKYRHPHIYGDVEAETSEEVKRNWESLKLRKKARKGGLLAGVPSSLPAMVKALRVGAKAAGAGFDWEQPEDVWAKVQEEILEVAAEIESGDKRSLEGEFGDLLFAVINAARLYDVDPEAALERTNRKFISRFNAMEQCAVDGGKSISELTLEQMEELWQMVKNDE